VAAPKPRRRAARLWGPAHRRGHPWCALRASRRAQPRHPRERACLAPPARRDRPLPEAL